MKNYWIRRHRAKRIAKLAVYFVSLDGWEQALLYRVANAKSEGDIKVNLLETIEEYKEANND